MELRVGNGDFVDISTAGFNWRLTVDLRDDTFSFEMEYSDAVGFSEGIVDIGSKFSISHEGINIDLVLKEYRMISSNFVQGPYVGNYYLKATRESHPIYNRSITTTLSGLISTYNIKASSPIQGSSEINFVGEKLTNYGMISTILKRELPDVLVCRDGSGKISIKNDAAPTYKLSTEDHSTGISGENFQLLDKKIHGLENPLKISKWDGKTASTIEPENRTTGYLSNISTHRDDYDKSKTVNFLNYNQTLSNLDTIEVLTSEYLELGSTVEITVPIMSSDRLATTTLQRRIVRNEFMFKGLTSQASFINRITVSK